MKDKSAPEPDIKGVYKVERLESKTNRWGNIYQSLTLSRAGESLITQVFHSEIWAPFKGFFPAVGSLVYVELWKDLRDGHEFLRPLVIRPATHEELAGFNKETAPEPEGQESAAPHAPDTSREAVIARSFAVLAAAQSPQLNDPSFKKFPIGWFVQLMETAERIRHYIETGDTEYKEAEDTD